MLIAERMIVKQAAYCDISQCNYFNFFPDNETELCKCVKMKKVVIIVIITVTIEYFLFS